MTTNPFKNWRFIFFDAGAVIDVRECVTLANLIDTPPPPQATRVVIEAQTALEVGGMLNWHQISAAEINQPDEGAEARLAAALAGVSA